MQVGPDAIKARREQLFSRLRSQRLSLLLVTHPPNLFYLTGFKGSAGVAVIGPSDCVLWVDPRYTLQAREEAREIEVVEHRGELLKAAGGWLNVRRAGDVGYEEAYLSCKDFQLMARECGRAARPRPASGMVEELRAVKGPEEIACLRQAGQLTREVYEEVRPQVRAGVAEQDLAAEIEYRMRRKGAQGAAFDTIVASGHRAALPHARASAKPLQSGELVILDLGAILAGYAADMTRTLYLGEPSRSIRRLYGAVLEAQQAAVSSLRAGTAAGHVDRRARSVLRRRGLAKYFTHSTGHGVGLEIHERPRLGKNEKSKLKVGCVVTAEPGVYLEGLGGIRLEDTVLVRTEGPEILTPAPKEHWFNT